MEKQFIVAVGVGISVSLMVACSATSERGPLSPTVLSPADRNDSRVEDLGPGPAPTPTPTPVCNPTCPPVFRSTFTFRFTAASGDTLSGICPVGFFFTCPLAGTGRFAGAVLRHGVMTTEGTEVFTLHSSFSLSGNQLAVTVLLELPSLGGQLMVVTGVLDAQVQTHADSGCESGLRQDVTFSGVLPQLGTTTGTYSQCLPA
jgi:hypothetical protein